MKNSNMESDIYADNFVEDRRIREIEKYGPRLPLAKIAAHPIRDERHSIEPAYGHYDRPINESV